MPARSSIAWFGATVRLIVAEVLARRLDAGAVFLVDLVRVAAVAVAGAELAERLEGAHPLVATALAAGPAPEGRAFVVIVDGAHRLLVDLDLATLDPALVLDEGPPRRRRPRGAPLERAIVVHSILPSPLRAQHLAALELEGARRAG